MLWERSVGEAAVDLFFFFFYQAQRQREEESMHMLIHWLNDDQRLEQADRLRVNTALQAAGKAHGRAVNR